MRCRRGAAGPLAVARHAKATVLLTVALTLLLTGYVSARPQAPATPEVEGRSVMDGVFTARQARRGKRSFDQICEQCHRIRDFTSLQFQERWTGQSVGDLLQFMQNTMPPENPGALGAERYADVMAYFLAANGYPSGEEELPADASTVLDLRIEAPPAEEAPEDVAEEPTGAP
jgi:S-disulfanyl-L-cysteine oxidoreductase SoxD